MFISFCNCVYVLCILCHQIILYAKVCHKFIHHMPNKFWLYMRLSIKEFWLKQELNEAQGLKSRTSVLNKQS